MNKKSRARTQRLSVAVDPDLKRRLRKEAKRAGLSLSEWIRTRLELEGTDPREVRALLKEFVRLGERISRSNAAFEAQRAEAEARAREFPARMEEAKRQGRELAERLLARGMAPPSTRRGSST